MEEFIRAIQHINEEITEIKRQIEILKKRPDVLFREEWMDGQDVMLALHISKYTLRSLRRSGKLPFARLHRKIYYKVSDIKALLKENYIRYHLKTEPSQVRRRQ